MSLLDSVKQISYGTWMLGEGPLIKTVGSVSEDKTNKVEMRTLPPPFFSGAEWRKNINAPGSFLFEGDLVGVATLQGLCRWHPGCCFYVMH